MVARGDDLVRLQSVAAHLRDLGTGDRITYSRKVFIPLTMLCRDHCHYCTFAKPPAQARSAVPDAGGGARHRSGRPRSGVQGGAVHPRRSAGGPLRGGSRVAALARVRLDARVRARVRHQRDRGNRSAPAPESGRDELRGARAAEAGERIDGADAGDVVGSALGEGRAALRFSRTSIRPCGCGRSRTRAGSRSRSPPASSSASVRTLGNALRSVFAIRDLHRRYGHIQEVIVQNFRAKPGTAMAGAPEPEEEEFLAAVATTRVVMGPHVSVQAPPNLSDATQQLRFARRRDQRLGRRLTAHPRSREPRAAVAGDRFARRDDGRARQDPARATDDLSAVRGKSRSVPRGQDACARSRPCWVTTASRSRGRSPSRRAGRTRMSPGSRGRSTSRSRRVRRRACGPTPAPCTGRCPRRTPSHEPGPRERSCRSASARRCERPCGGPNDTARSRTSRRWRCSRRRAPISTPSAGSPTASGRRPSATSSPT